MENLARCKTLMFAVLSIALIIAVLGVLNTVLMSVMEKLREFGYMRCIGASPWNVFQIVLIETVSLCLAGGRDRGSRRASQKDFSIP